ncbi:MAG TPA: hypothetical protein VG106_10705 [Vicinamibacterales bacterium]|nr:hypothetical protein [Vicinamibacterales bacterium]
MSPRRARVAVVALIAVAALAAVQAAFAELPVIRFVAADQAAAKASTLRLSDLGAGWKGGPQKPDFSDDTKCTGYYPKQSDLVVTGAAEAEFTSAGAFVSSTAYVLQTPRMVQVDWQRTVVHPQVIRCLREVTAKQSGVKVASVARVPFPKVAPLTARIRLVLDYTTPNGKVRMLMDAVFLGKGRSELMLMVGAPYGDRAAADAAEARLARLMVGRTRG